MFIVSVAPSQEGNGIYFLKHLYHARKIRNNIIDSFEKAAIPGMSDDERRRLLSFIIVGGGPTSCEFATELHGAFVLLDCEVFLFVPLRLLLNYLLHA